MADTVLGLVLVLLASLCFPLSKREGLQSRLMDPNGCLVKVLVVTGVRMRLGGQKGAKT